MKESDIQSLKPVPVQSTNSQVRQESLEELQPGEQITNTVYSPRIGNIKELQDTEQYLYKPEYQTNGIQWVNQTINMDTHKKEFINSVINRNISDQLILRLSMKGNLPGLLLEKRSYNMRNIL